MKIIFMAPGLQHMVVKTHVDLRRETPYFFGQLDNGQTVYCQLHRHRQPVFNFGKVVPIEAKYRRPRLGEELLAKIERNRNGDERLHAVHFFFADEVARLLHKNYLSGSASPESQALARSGQQV